MTFAALALGCIAFSMLQSLVAPALPAIRAHFDASSTATTWVMSAYLLSAGVATPIVGRLGDLYGKRRGLVLSLAALAAGSAMAAVVTSTEGLILARIIQGVGGAVYPLSFGIVRDTFPAHRTAHAISTISGLLAVGVGLGMVFAGPILEHLGFAWLFWIPFGAVLVAAAAAMRFVPRSARSARGGVNLTGALFMSAFLLCILAATSQGPHWGWGSPAVISLYLASLLSMGAWMRSESRARYPLVDMKMMRIRAVFTANVATLLLGAAMFCAFLVIPQFLANPGSSGFGFSASVSEAGFVLLPLTVMMVLASPLSSSLGRRAGTHVPLAVGASAVTSSFVFLVFAHGDIWEFFAASTVLGAGIGLAFAAMANLVIEAVPPHQTGVAAGMNTVTRIVGGALGAQAAGSIIVSSLAPGGAATERGYQIAFAFAAVCAAGATAGALAVPDRRSARRR